MKTNKGLQTTLSKFINKSKNNITEIRWSIIFKARQNVPKNPEKGLIGHPERS